jgi:hypothetical protein
MTQIDARLIDLAIDALSDIDRLYIDANYLVEDIYALAVSFSEPAEFQSAVANTVRALNMLIEQSVDVAALDYDLKGWQSYHYQSSVAQGKKADCRIIFKRRKECIEVKCFGHRRLPADIYKRMKQSRV